MSKHNLKPSTSTRAAIDPKREVVITDAMVDTWLATIDTLPIGLTNTVVALPVHVCCRGSATMLTTLRRWESRERAGRAAREAMETAG